MSSDAVPGENPEVDRIESYPGFDWLRIVLASVVVLGHEGVVLPGAIDGGLAVQVFFALSGWLIGGILLRTSRREMPRFFFNRATRIWIPYFAAVAALYGLAAIYEGVGPFWAKYLFYDATFTHQLFTRFPQAGLEMPLKGAGNQFWSISVEEQFYLAAPVVMFFLPMGKRLWPWVAVAVLAYALPGGFFSVSLGVIAAILRRDRGDWHLSRFGRPAVLAVTVIVLAALMVTNDQLLRSAFSIGTVLSLAKSGRRRALPVFLGGVSYPLYLNHWAGAFVAHGILKHVLHGSNNLSAFVIVAYAASLVIGIAAYLLIDRTVLKRRQDWFNPARGRVLGATAYTLVAAGLIGGRVFS